MRSEFSAPLSYVSCLDMEEKEESFRQVLGLRWEATGRFSPRMAKLFRMLYQSGYEIFERIRIGIPTSVLKAEIRPGSRAASMFGARHAEIKVLEKESMTSEERDSLDREVLAHCRVHNHPNILSFYEVLENEYDVCLATELLKGPNLSSVLDKRASGMSEELAIYLFTQVTSALQYMHKLGCAHRNVKPDNIVFKLQPRGSESLCLCLTDFSLAYASDPLAAQEFFTAPVVGTFGYTAPEVFTKSQYNPILADIWSAGVLLYFAISRRLPFQGEDPFKMQVDVEKGADIFHCLDWQSVSSPTKRLILSCLDVKPAQRPTADRVFEVVSGEILGTKKVTFFEKMESASETNTAKYFHWSLLWVCMCTFLEKTRKALFHG